MVDSARSPPSLARKCSRTPGKEGSVKFLRCFPARTKISLEPLASVRDCMRGWLSTMVDNQRRDKTRDWFNTAIGRRRSSRTATGLCGAQVTSIALCKSGKKAVLLCRTQVRDHQDFEEHRH